MAAFTRQSHKSLGKRPARALAVPVDADSPTSDASATLDTQLETENPKQGKKGAQPQKRVLPSRSRRGGPGFGSSDVDSTILEALKNQCESEPLIPSTSVFLLTTDSDLVPSTSASAIASGFNSFTTDRYFDRPDVLRAYQQQQSIQTPKFESLGDFESVGGRLRARGEEESADTSDAAYEKRHKKFEAFEKRQRLREKEKLQHEHYKLKERIEQIRAMDVSSFASLPDSLFPPSFKPPAPEGDDDEEDSIAEGRKRAVLSVALALHTRYKALLPERRFPGTSRQSEGESMEPEQADEVPTPTSVITEKKRPVRSRSPLVGEQEIPVSQPGRKRRRNTVSAATHALPIVNHNADSFRKNSRALSPEIGIDLPRGPVVPAAISPTPEPEELGDLIEPPEVGDPPSAIAEAVEAPTSEPLQQLKFVHVQPSPDVAPEPSISTAAKRTRASKTNGNASSYDTYAASNSRSYVYHDAGTPTSNYSAHISTRRVPLPAIVVAASRHADIPDARKTTRHVLAFGVKVPRELDEQREFQIPDWIDLPDDLRLRTKAVRTVKLNVKEPNILNNVAKAPPSPKPIVEQEQAPPVPANPQMDVDEGQWDPPSVAPQSTVETNA